MRFSLKLLILITSISLCMTVPLFAVYENLTLWQQGGSTSDGNWVSVGGNSSRIKQTTNGAPTFWMSPTNFIGGSVSGYFHMSSSDMDNDMVGFVIGNTHPTSTSDSTRQHILFDWKQGDQGSSLAGLYLSYVNSNSSADYWAHSSGMVNAVTPHGVVNSSYTSLTGNARSGWSWDTEYMFYCDYFPDSITVRIAYKSNNSTVLSITTVPAAFGLNEFPSGSFGFYNYSQGQVTYGDFTPIPLSLVGSGDKLTYKMGADPTVLEDNMILGGPNFSGFEVKIITNWVDTDVLTWNSSVASGHGITGSYNASNGTLTFSGHKTPASYQAVLRTVKFKAIESPIKRIIRFTFGPGEAEYQKEVNVVFDNPIWFGAPF